ncbi:hypothetical protein SK128_014957, partial [Halocaridina rubra]
ENTFATLREGLAHIYGYQANYSEASLENTEDTLPEYTTSFPNTTHTPASYQELSSSQSSLSSIHVMSSLQQPSTSASLPVVPTETLGLKSSPPTGSVSVSLSSHRSLSSSHSTSSLQQQSTATSSPTIPTEIPELEFLQPIQSVSVIVTEKSSFSVPETSTSYTSTIAPQESSTEPSQLINKTKPMSSEDTDQAFILNNLAHCLENLNITQDQINKNLYGKLTQNCWEILLCSGAYPIKVKPDTGEVIYWLKNINEECYDQLSTENGATLSKYERISAKVHYIVLNPKCAGSNPLAHLEILDEELQLFPEQCRKLLCYSGVSSLNYNNFPISMFYPYPMDAVDYIVDCQAALHERMQHITESTEKGHANIIRTLKYPISSPCTTYTVFAITKSGSHIMVPFRSNWCRPLKKNMWQSLIISSYMEFLTGTDLELYRCLLWKTYYNSPKMEDMNFLLDLLGKELQMPNFPQPCISYMCDSRIDILKVHESDNDHTLFWYTHMKNLTQSIPYLKPQLLECEIALSESKNDTDNENIILSLPGTLGEKPVPFIFTYHWSCPNDDHDDESNYLRSEILASLWLKDENLPAACKLLICRSKIQRLDTNLISAFLIHSREYTSTCQEYSEHVTIFDVGEYIFSFEITQINTTVVFMIANSARSNDNIRLLSHLHASGEDRGLQCCASTYTNIEDNIYHADGRYYFLCPVNSTGSAGSVCLHANSLWTVRHVNNNTSLVTIKESLAHAKFIHWLATLDTTFTSSSHLFIMNAKVQEEEFLNNLIFASTVRNREGKSFSTFLSELRAKKVKCTGTHFVTLCHRPDSKFLFSESPDGYMVFLHQCPVKSYEKDKLILLLLRHFLMTGPSQEYICQENNMAVMVSTEPKVISYSAKGSAEEVAIILSSLQTMMKSWSWTEQQGHTGTRPLDSTQCTELRRISEFPRFLDTGSCMSYNLNNATISLKPKYKMFYHLQTFPVIDLESESSLWDLIVSNSPVVSSLVKYSIEIKGFKFFITRESENPAHKFLHHRNIIDFSAHRLSVHHLAKLSLLADLNNNSQCHQDLQNYDFFLYVHTPTIWIGPIHDRPARNSCFSSLSKDTIRVLHKSVAEQLSTINKFWPSCFYNMMVSWPQKTSVITDWDYLPSECKIIETVLLSVIIMVSLVFLIGNTFALLVIVRSYLYKKSTFLIYISLALADLLLGVFPVTLAIYDTVSLRYGKLTFQELNLNFWNTTLAQLELHQTPDFSQISFERSGYPVFCSIVLSTSLGASLFSLVLLGLNQLKTQMKRPLLYRQVIIGLSASWITCIINAFLMHWRIEGWSFLGILNPVTKITSSIGSESTSMPLPVFYMMVVGTSLITIVILILVISISMISHYHRQNPCKVWISGDNDTRKNHKQDARIYQVLVGTSVLICVPLLIDKLVQLNNVSPLGHFLIHWLSMAGLSWRWSLYTLQNKAVRRDLSRVWCWQSRKSFSQISPALSADANDNLEITQLTIEMQNINSNESLSDRVSD